jgi:hypothetical protein
MADIMMKPNVKDNLSLDVPEKMGGGLGLHSLIARPMNLLL